MQVRHVLCKQCGFVVNKDWPLYSFVFLHQIRSEENFSVKVKL